ncbi:MAG TPA: hypothetical protein VMU41_08850, partial [Candidatus Binataceae bacterium]|nr:hypothetical protein [Candidatus Binataceae bacterium]
MPNREIPNRSDRLFGREQDLRELSKSADRKGVTVIVGRPMMGKSWVLAELARRLAQNGHWLVGRAQSYGQSSDVMLYAVVDLYQRWLSDLNYRKQAKLVWQQEREKLLPTLAKAFGAIFKIVPGVGRPTAEVVKGAIEGLLTANEDLKTGGTKLPALAYEQARDLVNSVFEVGNTPICLFFDQCEDSLAFGLGNILNTFLRDREDWPRCHIFLAVREEDGPALEQVNDLARQHAAAVLYTLEEMDLSEPSEERRLISFLRERVLAVAGLEDRRILEHVAGFPGVVQRWTEEGQPEWMRSEADLKKVADDAQRYRFRELEKLLPALSDDQRKIAIRLALVPFSTSSDRWERLRKLITNGVPAKILDELGRSGALVSTRPPSFGHDKRLEAALSQLKDQCRYELEDEGRDLVLRLAESIKAVDLKYIDATQALAHLAPLCEELDWGIGYSALCDTAAGLLGHRVDTQKMLGGVHEARNLKGISALLAMGLYSSLCDSTEEQQLARRDALLDELRTLAQHYP